MEPGEEITRRPARAFLSYGQPDRSVAERLCAEIERRDVRCWIAPRDIAPGETWAGAIVDAIRACEVFVLVLSKASNASSHVQREVGQAVENGAPVFLLRLDAVELASSLAYFLGSQQFLEVDASRGDRSAQVARLADAVVAQVETGRAVVAPAPARQRRSRRLVAAAVLAPLLAAGALSITRPWQSADDGGSADVDERDGSERVDDGAETGGASSDESTPSVEDPPPWEPLPDARVVTTLPFVHDLQAGRVRTDGSVDLVALHDEPDGTRRVSAIATDGTRWSVAADSARAFAVGDLDRDGFDDVAVDGGAGTSTIWSAGPDGELVAGAVIEGLHPTPLALACTDLDLDGFTDLLSIGPGQDPLLGSYGGAAGFRASTSVTSVAKVESGLTAIGDLDGDGWSDPVVVDDAGDGIVYWASTLGDPQQPCDRDLLARTESFLTSANPVAVHAADLDGDGDDEILVVGRAPGELTIHEAASSGDVQRAAVLPVPDATCAELLDLDDDGFLDLALGHAGPAAPLSAARGPLLVAEELDVVPLAAPLPVPSVHALVAADFDEDGRDSLVAWDAESGDLVLLEREPGGLEWRGGFELHRELRWRGDLGEPADLDGDGFAELVSTESEVGEEHTIVVTAIVNEARPAAVGLPERYDVMTNPDPGGWIYHAELGDFDGDGRDEVAVLFRDEQDLVLIHGGTDEGRLALQSSVTIGMNSGWDMTMVAGDFAGGERLELLVPIGGLISYADGRYSLNPFELDLTSKIDAADLDGDGVVDAHWRGRSGRSWARAATLGCPPRGTGRFEPEHRPLPLEWTELADVDGNGLADAIGFDAWEVMIQRASLDAGGDVAYDALDRSSHVLPIDGLVREAIAPRPGPGGAVEFVVSSPAGFSVLNLAGAEPRLRFEPVPVDLAGTHLADSGLGGAEHRLVADLNSDDLPDLLLLDEDSGYAIVLLGTPGPPDR